MGSAYINCIATAVPDFDIHAKFVEYAPSLLTDKTSQKLFSRMAKRAEIEHRYSVLEPNSDPDLLDSKNFYERHHFPSTQRRMEYYEHHAIKLAYKALNQINLEGVTHLIVTSCTGFYAPGLDLQIVNYYGLSPSIERTIIGFMGCYAAFNALKLARHIVRSDNAARVLIVNLELCTLHLMQSSLIEEILSFLIFADGCAACIVSNMPEGLEIDRFQTLVMPHSTDQITWKIGDLGFNMTLSGQVPSSISKGLSLNLETMLAPNKKQDIVYWAIHPGGRSILDAVKDGAELQESQLAHSRNILRRFGNMSSATIMFVLQEIMKNSNHGEQGFAMAFGPGLTVESMHFQVQKG